MWDLVNEMWPLDTRPKLLQSRKTVEKMSIAEISQFKDHYEKEEEKKGAGSAVYGKDRKLKPVNFKKGSNDGVSKLHAARFQLPVCLFATSLTWRRGVPGMWQGPMPAKTQRACTLPMPATGWISKQTSSACSCMPGAQTIEG